MGKFHSRLTTIETKTRAATYCTRATSWTRCSPSAFQPALAPETTA
jgi:hypothetical protein